MICWLLQTWRGTATCCTTGVLEITRAMMSSAEAGKAANAEAAATEEMTSAFFMIVPLSGFSGFLPVASRRFGHGHQPDGQAGPGAAGLASRAGFP
jgi:hypothetical protein